MIAKYFVKVFGRLVINELNRSYHNNLLAT